MDDAGKWLLIACVAAFTAMAAIVDARYKKLPNKLTVSACLLGLVFHLTIGAWNGGASGALQGALSSLGGFAVGFGVLLVLWLVGGGGGGDVKFMGALGAWLGPVLIFFVLIGSLVFVAFGSVVMLAIESSRLGVEGTRRRYFRSSKSKGSKAPKNAPEQATRRRLLPYAVPVALATWTTLAVSYLANSQALSRLVGQG